jgi:nucleotide-binding universal stress UspA family protein
VSDVILHEACKHKADLILMGGYGYPPLLEALFGSTVDDVLRRAKIPVLICQ